MRQKRRARQGIPSTVEPNERTVQRNDNVQSAEEKRHGDTLLPSVPRHIETGVRLALAPHEERDLFLQQSASRLMTRFFDFTAVAIESISNKDYERFGFIDAPSYFDERIRLNYRSLRRYISIVEGIRRIPDTEQADAKLMLATLGSHKAAEVARIMGRDQGSPWQDIIEMAGHMTEEALREEISARLGSKPRGLPNPVGERFLLFVLNQVPPDVRDHVEATFKALMRRFELTSAVAAFLILVDLGATEVAAWERPDA